MGLASTKEQSVTTAIENQDVTELRTIMRDLTPEQIRTLGKSLATLDENQCTILHYATWQDNPELLAPFLDYADDLELRDGFGWTPLMTAVNRGSKPNVNLLLGRGAKVDCDSCGGMSLIADAMNFSDAELVLILIDHGARVIPTPEMLANGQEQSVFHLLHYAVDDGLPDIAQLLIEKGRIPLNTLDQSGWSPLHLAAGHNNSVMALLLLDKGADVNIRDSNGNTPLAWAREMNGKEVMNELEKRGGVADIEWHGDKLEMKSQDQREAEWAASENDQDTEDQEKKEKVNPVEASRFEIEIEDPKTKQQTSANSKDSNIIDGLQRQRPRPSANTVF